MKLRRATGVLILVSVVVAALGAGLLVQRAPTARAWAQARAAGTIPADAPDRLSVVVAPLQDRVERRDAAALAELAQVYQANGYVEQALGLTAVLAELQPAEAKWPYLAAVALAGFGRLEEAEAHLQRAVELAPAYLPGRLRLGELRLKTNRPTEAAACFEAALEVEPDSPWARVGLARVAIADGRWPEARRLLARVTAEAPDFFAANSLLTTVHEYLGETAEAERARQRARQVGRYREPPDPWIEALHEHSYDVYRLHVAAAALEDPAAARRWLERALALEPDNPKTHRLLARTWLASSASDAARHHADRAAALAPDEPAAYLEAIAVYRSTGDEAGARRWLTRGLEQCPEEAGLHFERGRAAAQDGDVELAVASFRRAIELAPDELAAYLELATQEFRRDQIETARETLEAALQRDPHHPPALVLLARLHIRQGQRTEAADLLMRASQVVGRASELQRAQQEFDERFRR